MPYVEIESIEEIGEDETYDLNIKDNHNFYLRNGILSHNSGTGKGEGQKMMQNIVRYFNMRIFAQRYGCEKFPDDLWMAYERFKQVQKAFKRAHMKEDTVEELDPEVEKLKEAVNAAPDKKPPTASSYSLSPKAKMEFIQNIKDHQGKYWKFFINTFQAYPMIVETNIDTSAKLVGGFEPGTGKNPTPVLKSGVLATQSIYAWDEAQNMLKESKGAESNYRLLCSALDNIGEVTTKARKDLDEFGNAYGYTTYCSIMTGTTEISELDSAVAQGGLLQRFLLQYYVIPPEDWVPLRDAMNQNTRTPEDLWKAIEEYYKCFTASPIFTGRMTMSPEAIIYINELHAKDNDYVEAMFGHGTQSYTTMQGFLQRRDSFYYKMSAIIAALDNMQVVQVEHVKKMYEVVGMPTLEATCVLLDQCLGSRMTISEKKERDCNAVLKEIFEQAHDKGEMFLAHNDIAERLRTPEYHGRWPKSGPTTTSTAITSWAKRNPTFVKVKKQSRVMPDGTIKEDIFYMLRVESPEFEKKRVMNARIKTDSYIKDQGVEKKGWAELARQQALSTPAPVAPPNGGSTVTDIDEAENDAGPSIDAVKKALQEKKEKDARDML